MNFLSQIINGLSIGSIYALVALGYSMVYGIVNLINFAHGDIIMVGAFMIYLAMVMSGMNLWVAIIFAIIMCVVFGILIERIAYRRLLKKEVARISLLITAIGVSIFLQNFFQMLFTSTAKNIPNLFPGENIHIGALQIGNVTMITIITTLVLMVLLQILVKKTKIGKAMRATSEDPGASKLMGINSNVTIAFTFGLGSALAAVAAVLYCATYPLITPYIGSMLGLKAFVAAVLGGIGSIPGAILGGLILGVCEALTKAVGLSQIADAVVFALLIIVLLVKPSGFLGKSTREKV